MKADELLEERDYSDIVPVDEHLFNQAMRGAGSRNRNEIRLAYSLIECWCASALEARIGIQLAMYFCMYGGDADEIREFIRPQYPVGWCKLDFLVAPYRQAPHLAFAIECDGEAWHNAEKDARRDAWVMANDEVVREIYRFPGEAIKNNASNLVFKVLRDFAAKHETLETGKMFV